MADAFDHGIERLSHELMHLHRIIAVDEVRRVAVAAKQRFELVTGNAGKHGGACYLVAVQMQDRQDRAVMHRIEKFVRMPAGGEWTGFRLAIAHDASDQEVGIVEGGTIGERQAIAEFTAFIDGARSLRRNMTRNATGKRKLREQFFHPRFVLRDVRIELGVTTFEIGVGHETRAAVPGACDVQYVQVMLVYDTVQMHIDEVQPRSGAPVAEESRLHVLKTQGNLEQRVIIQIDLSDREIVGCTPIRVHLLDEVERKRAVHRPIHRSVLQWV